MPLPFFSRPKARARLWGQAPQHRKTASGVLVRTRETPRRFPYASLLRAKTEVRFAYRLRLFLAGEKPPAFASQNRKSSPARICFAKSREDAEKARRRRSSLRRAAFEVATRETLGVSLTTFPCGREAARICFAKSEKLNASRRRFAKRTKAP